MELEPKQIMQARIAERLGMEQYGKIMQTVRSVDVSADPSFQKLFNGYYVVRRNETWRRTYYTLFEAMKGKPATFREIIHTLFVETKNIEASFASKMLATLHPDRPIWDQNVLQNLHLRLTGKTRQDTLENAVTLYARIEQWYAEMRRTGKAQDCYAVFDQTFPHYTQVNDTKKLDFFLWSKR